MHFLAEGGFDEHYKAGHHQERDRADILEQDEQDRNPDRRLVGQL